ncbi:DUF5677 domain-containing protein [Paenibacillus sp. FSL K6-3182]|uniref:DUF5677 domain-containing protein n=1 Tax=Paenibacillus sp. FSL K6-3182 TaxID=2921495 RepID=UPI0030D290AE
MIGDYDQPYPLLESLSQTILFADKLLEEAANKGGYTDTEVITFSLFRQLIEQVDGIFIGVDHNNYDLARTSLRNAFETNLAIEYIYKDPALLNDRALAYKVGSKYQNIAWFDMAIQEKILEPEVQEAELISKKSALETELNLPALSRISTEWIRTKAGLRRDGTPKWYSLYNGPSSIYALAKHLDMESEYKRIYGSLSATIHGTTALDRVALESGTGKVLIWPLRDEEREKAETPIYLGRAFLLNMIGILVRNYEPTKAIEFGPFLEEHIEPTRA